MTATLLPNAKQQFLDSNGRPLAGGSVYFYIPNTSTFKNTWQDAGKTILNTNPVVLDANGQAIIYGDSQYRQVVYDVRGNLIWDKLTDSPALNSELQNVYTNLSASGGSSLIGFLQAGVGAIPITLQDKGRQTVNLKEFGAVGDGLTDDRSAIQRALDAFPTNVIVRGGGKSYRITGSIYIRGNQKMLDFEDGQLVLDTALNNQQAVVIDNPNTTPTVYQGLKNVLITASTATQATTSSTGIAMSSGVLHPFLENVYIQNFGRTSGSGTAMTISGGPLGGTDTPYYGEFRNVKIQLCAAGLGITANLAYPNITTHFFHDLVIGGCTGVGLSLINAQSCTFTGISFEQNGTNLSLDHCKDNYFFGGLVEGGNPNISITNQDANFNNVFMLNVYPASGNTWATPLTYYNAPAFGLQGNTPLIERQQGIQVNFGANVIMQLKYPGIVTIQTDQGTAARFWLNSNTVSLIETLGTTSAWSTTKGGTNFNVYYDGAASPPGYYFQNNIGSGINCRFHNQVGL